MTLCPASTAIIEQGYASFEGVCTPDEVGRLREGIEALVREAGSPVLHSVKSQPLNDWAMLTSTGLALHRALHRRPDFVDLVLKAPVLDAVRAVLGEDMRIEVAGAVVSDAARPFFTWHTHIDGVDEGERVRAGHWPNVHRARRVLTLLYLDDLDEEGGPLLVLPRRLGDPTRPPGDLDVPDWPGHVELRVRAGTLVALEQCTWHAARSRRRPGLRMLFGCYFAAADEPPGAHTDPDIRNVPSCDPVFRSLVDRSPSSPDGG
jgi:ectoine hydroxylase-related dioxygenase (phytanoyl-CoA dioxygenase family)